MGVDPEAQFHVLAVDDMTVSSTESSLRGFSGHLPTEGGTLTANVTTMDSGSKALEVLGLMEDQDISSPASTYKNQIEVNLVITDCCMPGMTGYDLLKKIKVDLMVALSS
ncbi:two-component response regulator ORR4-like [Musa acuminata AAA Group]|uniref:two-component response regulator ORR4-like n=1 Tax=Musa acuminata AAA Group TaxID=214697 RepID=UPI0031E4068E